MIGILYDIERKLGNVDIIFESSRHHYYNDDIKIYNGKVYVPLIKIGDLH